MVNKISDEEMMAWIAKSCEDQGIPFYVEGEEAILRISTILRSAK